MKMKGKNGIHQLIKGIISTRPIHRPTDSPCIDSGVSRIQEDQYGKGNVEIY